LVQTLADTSARDRPLSSRNCLPHRVIRRQSAVCTSLSPICHFATSQNILIRDLQFLERQREGMPIRIVTQPESEDHTVPTNQCWTNHTLVKPCGRTHRDPPGHRDDRGSGSWRPDDGFPARPDHHHYERQPVSAAGNCKPVQQVRATHCAQYTGGN
jgi:hypothetical protein